MSLLLLEGCDDGLIVERWVTNAIILAAPPESRLGNVIDFSGAGVQNRSMIRNLAAAEEHATITVGFWFHLTVQTEGDNRFFTFRSDAGATTHVQLYPDAAGRLIVVVAEGTYTSDIIWAGTGTSHYIELQAVLHDTTGAFTLWVDGNVVLSETNIDTKSAGTKTVFDQVHIEHHPSGDNTVRGYIGDIYITNGAGASPYNGNLGDIIAVTLFPNGNGATSAFTGSDGNSTDNYLLVDEDPDHDSDTTYVESTVDGNRDSYEFTDLPYVTGVIRGVIVTAVARQLGAADNLQITTRIAAADYDGPTLAIPGAYDASLDRVMQLSPATTAAWTIAEINAAEFGIENVS